MLAFVSFPGAPLTESLICNALEKLDESIIITDTLSPAAESLLQYCSYDSLDHELTHSRPEVVLSSSYTIRKSLIRKHYLHRAVSLYVAKKPDCILTASIPRSWDIEIAWADELDDQFADELWDLSAILDNNTGNWFILKPGMADRGNGIRLFDSKQALHAIFDEFDEQSDAESEHGGQDIITSHLRHFVIQVCSLLNAQYLFSDHGQQEYLTHPLLLNPYQTLPNLQITSHTELPPYKVC